MSVFDDQLEQYFYFARHWKTENIELYISSSSTFRSTIKKQRKSSSYRTIEKQRITTWLLWRQNIPDPIDICCLSVWNVLPEELSLSLFVFISIIILCFKLDHRWLSMPHSRIRKQNISDEQCENEMLCFQLDHHRLSMPRSIMYKQNIAYGRCENDMSCFTFNVDLGAQCMVLSKWYFILMMFFKWLLCWIKVLIPSK